MIIFLRVIGLILEGDLDETLRFFTNYARTFSYGFLNDSSSAATFSSALIGETRDSFFLNLCSFFTF